jgi:hypothetical protein
MRTICLTAVLLVVMATGALAQATLELYPLTAREMGMGGARVGVADDAMAWLQNPAGLAALNVPVAQGSDWGSDFIGNYTRLYSGDTSDWGGTFSTWSPQRQMGFGAGYFRIYDDTNYFGVGFAKGFGTTPLSVGVNWTQFNDGGSDTLFDVGLMYRFVQPDRGPVRLGLVARDVSGTFDGPWFDLGIAWPVTTELLLAVDATDVTDQTGDGPFFSFGAEYKFAPSGWVVRAGGFDTGKQTDFCAGVGYGQNNWRINVGYMNLTDDNNIAADFGITF